MNAIASSPVKISLKKSEKPSERLFTIEEYYEREEKSIHKHEYHNGKIVLMPGSKYKHNRIAARIISFLEIFIEANQLNFEVSTGDTKIRIDNFDKIFYPDALVVSEKAEFFEGRENTITNPLLIVEVLSMSTSKFDKTSKFEMYRSLPSFKEYVLVYQDREQITVWTKQDDGSWLPKDYMGLESIAVLNVINSCPIELARLYRNL